MPNQPSKQKIHLVNPLLNPSGGSEWRTVSLYRELAPLADVSLWASPDAHEVFTRQCPVRSVKPNQGEYPNDGTLVLVGVYYPVGDWLEGSDVERVVLVYNTFSAGYLHKIYQRIVAMGRAVDIIYASALMRDSVKLPGVIEYSPIDLQRFTPRTPRDSAEFVIGRHSRDDPAKHHPADHALYMRLASQSCLVRIMGGTCLKKTGIRHDSIQLLPSGAMDAADYLRGLDVFYYRTGTWLEPWGRVVTEAMACGLPVVAHRRGGYTELIRQNENGFLFDTDEQAFQLITRLRDDRELWRRISAAARASVEENQSAATRAASLDVYLRAATSVS